MRRAAAVLAVLACTAVALAAAEKPGERFARPLGFALVGTNVAEVTKVLGEAPVQESGHHEQAVCYAWPGQKTIVTFMSQAEGLGGQFTMRRLAEPAPAECVPVDSRAAACLKLEVGGLRLGMFLHEFETVVGKVASFPDGTVGITYERSEPIDHAEHPLAVGDRLFTTIGIRGRFVDARLVELTVWKTAST